MNDTTKERLINFAKKMQDLRTGRSLHFAFILDKKRTLVWAVNNYNKLHPYHKFGVYVPTRKYANYTSGIHAECGAIKQFINKFGNNDVSGLTMFILRLSSSGEVMTSMPCINCQRIINQLNFKEIVWT